LSTDFLGTQWRWGRSLLVLVVTSLLFAVAAEIAARLDDRVERGIAFFSSPSYDGELRTVRDGIIQGRAFGEYEKYKLNSWGFRSPEIGMEKKPGCRRVMVIGGSEMFGLYESPGKDFTAVLLSRLNERDCFEMINAGMSGMSLDAAMAYWRLRLVKFKPDIVMIYATPALQITDSFPPAPYRPRFEDERLAHGFQLRFLEWMRQYVHLPEAMQDWKVEREYKAEIASHPAGWVIDSPPEAGFKSFDAKLHALIDAVKSTGAAIVLMTHAERATPDTLDSHPHDVSYFKQNYPRVAPRVQLEFNEIADARVREITAQENLRLVDIDHLLSGCRECFADPVHFSDLGAERAADAAAQVLLAQQGS
jgi:hypothetical protein